jgi:hypothetical protein
MVSKVQWSGYEQTCLYVTQLAQSYNKCHNLTLTLPISRGDLFTYPRNLLLLWNTTVHDSDWKIQPVNHILSQLNRISQECFIVL